MRETMAEIIRKVIVDIAAVELMEVLRKIFLGEDLDAQAAGGDPAAQALHTEIVAAGLNPGTLSQADWASFGQQAEATLGGNSGNFVFDGAEYAGAAPVQPDHAPTIEASHAGIDGPDAIDTPDHGSDTGASTDPSSGSSGDF
jgi:hypothetical protein